MATESVGGATEPTPIILASHDEASKSGIHGAALLDVVGSVGGAEYGSAGAEASLVSAVVEVSSKVSVRVKVGSPFEGAGTPASVVLE